MLAQTEVIGPQVNLPGSQQLAPVFFGILTLGWVALLVVSLLVRRARNRDGHRPVPVVSIVVAVAAAASLVMTIVWWPPPFTSPEFPPTGRLFPDEAFFYRTAEDLPVAPDSARWIGALGDDPLGAGFGGEPVDGIVFGVPFNPVDDDTPTARGRDPVQPRPFLHRPVPPRGPGVHRVDAHLRVRQPLRRARRGLPAGCGS